MKARAKRLATVLAVAALLAIGFWASVLTGQSSASSVTPTVPHMTTGSFTMTYSAGQCESQINQSLPACWNCTYPVDLDQVDITINPATAALPNSNTEGVRLGDGCTGRIGKLTVRTSGGDGVKVVKGAHDLVVGYGSVTCNTPPAGLSTDQYGIRSFGGKRVTFAGMYVNCRSSNSRFEFFVNQVPQVKNGPPVTDHPSDVLFVQGCLASGPRKTALVGTSEWSGIATSVLHPFTPGPANGPTYEVPSAPSGGGPAASNPLDFGNDYPAGQSNCVNANG